MLKTLRKCLKICISGLNEAFTKEILQYTLCQSQDFNIHLALEKAEQLKIMARERQIKRADYYTTDHATLLEKLDHLVEHFRNYILTLLGDGDYENVVEAILGGG